MINNIILKIIKNIALVVIFTGVFLSAEEYSFQFNFLDKTDDVGSAQCITELNDSTMIVSYGSGGVRAYSYTDDKFIHLSHLEVDEAVTEMAVTPSSELLFLTQSKILAYGFSGNSFNYIAQYNVHGTNGKIFAVNDSTVLFFRYNYGVYALKYKNSVFTFINSLVLKIIDMDMSDNRTMFFARGSYGLDVYRYENNTFTWKANHNPNYSLSRVLAVSDSILCVSDGEYYIYKYSFNGSYPAEESSHYIDYHSSLNKLDDNRFMLFNDYYGLGVYENIGEDGFSRIAEYSIGDSWRTKDACAVENTNMIFVAADADGVLALEIDNTSLRKRASIDNGGSATALSLWDDNTIVMSNNDHGIRVYDFTGSNFISKSHLPLPADIKHLAIGQNKIFASSRYGDIYCLGYNGISLSNVFSLDYTGYTNQMIFGQDGTLFIGRDWEGLFAYSLLSNGLSEKASIDNGCNAQELEIGTNGTIYLGNYCDGIRVYAFNGTGFINTAHLNEGFSYSNLAVLGDKTLFATSRYGLHVYYYDGKSLINKAEFSNDISAWDVAVHSDGTIIACFEDGLRSFIFDGTNLINTGYLEEIIAKQIEIASDGTVYTVNGSGGLRAYSFSGYVGIAKTGHPGSYHLDQNYPNPFNPVTVINYQLPDDSEVELSIHDISGRKITTLINDRQLSGYHTAKWNASPLPSGVYFYRLQAGDFVETKKMVLMK